MTPDVEQVFIQLWTAGTESAEIGRRFSRMQRRILVCRTVDHLPMMGVQP